MADHRRAVPRDLQRLTATAHDLLIVGGGIHGAWAAWDATLRGLSVALVDRGAFGGGTSANSLRIVHGGLRYLARGDLVRMRESIEERATLLRLAPRLVAPLPMLVPTYRHHGPRRSTLGVALALNDILSWRRNRGIAADRAIASGYLVTPAECARLFPAVERPGLTGGAVWHDGQLLDPVGLTSSIAAAAVGRGAVAASEVRVERLTVVDNQVTGARAIDCHNGTTLDIRARAVLVAAGPWGRSIAQPLVTSATTTLGRVEDHSPTGHALAINIRLARPVAKIGVGLHGHGRFFFLVPDEESTLAGTWYTLPDGSDARTLVARGTEALLAELNQACPDLTLSMADVVESQSGWLPLAREDEHSQPDALADRPRIVELRELGGPAGAVLLEGIKYTTARRVAAQAVDRVLAVLGAAPIRCRTAEVAP